MRKKFSTFWIFQIGGWLGYWIIICFLQFSISKEFTRHFFAVEFIEVVESAIITSVLRFVIIRSNVLQRKFAKQILFIFFSTLIVSLLFAFVNMLTEKLIIPPNESRAQEHELIIEWGFNFFLVLIWNLIYFSYHYVVRSNKERLDKVRLESLVKDLELKTIKAHINPHFIFNALNSIRYMVDENPARARDAITQLSILLRSSMRAEDASTTPLENELEIVQSYLDLEKLRFEERLHIDMNIDSRTRELPVPPMMLQTLVENAIKHGISRQISGGNVRISSSIEEENLVLKVQNTGKFQFAKNNRDGFGISGTKNRLALMYGEKAHFSIKEFTSNNVVEAEIKIPLQ